MLVEVSIAIAWAHKGSPTSFETNTVSGPASQKTPWGLIDETAQSIYEDCQ
jgi:hypothetical protein